MLTASHSRSVPLTLAAVLVLALAALAFMPQRVGAGGPPQASVRFATFNASLNRPSKVS